MQNGDNPLEDMEETKQGKTFLMYFRTGIYIFGILASIASLIIDTYGNHQLAQVIALIGSFLAGTFGVAFNPITYNGGKK